MKRTYICVAIEQNNLMEGIRRMQGIIIIDYYILHYYDDILPIIE